MNKYLYKQTDADAYRASVRFHYSWIVRLPVIFVMFGEGRMELSNFDHIADWARVNNFSWETHSCHDRIWFGFNNPDAAMLFKLAFM